MHVKISEGISGRKYYSHAILASMLKKLLSRTTDKTLNLANIKAVLFDLDGTLIDVDMERFVAMYLRRLTEQMSDIASPVKSSRAMLNAVTAMFANVNPDKTLEDVLMETLMTELNVTHQQYAQCLERFCKESLDELQSLVSGSEASVKLLETALARGWSVVLATNPIFPRAIVDARLRWGGLESNWFQYVASYETAHFCKPNPDFFLETCSRLEYVADECIMVGNDPLHDLAAGQAGMQTCLLTPWRVKRSGVAYKADWVGKHDDLRKLFEAA